MPLPTARSLVLPRLPWREVSGYLFPISRS